MNLSTIIGRSLALLALTLGGVVATGSAPASADITITCTGKEKTIDYFSSPTPRIYATAWFCDGPAAWATVERQDPSGTWVLVASGRGGATYYCSGTAITNYRTGTGLYDVSTTAPCG